MNSLLFLSEPIGAFHKKVGKVHTIIPGTRNILSVSLDG